MPVFTFLEHFDFSGKTILPFCTHEGSGLGRSENDIKRLCPGASVKQGLALHGGKGLNVKFDGNRLACGGKELLAWARQIRDS